MRRNVRQTWILLITIPLVLSGCSGGGDPVGGAPVDGAGGDDLGGDDPANETAGPPPVEVDEPPMARLTVMQGGAEPQDTNGSLPVAAGKNVTLDGSGSTDPEGTNLTFAWVLGDGATDVNATVNHTYGPGLFTVVLTVTDEAGLTDSATVHLNVSQSSPTIFFYDGGEEPADWTFEESIADFPAGDNTGEPNPLSAGWHTTEAEAFAGTASWTAQDESAGGYHDNEYTIMTSPTIDLANATEAYFSFIYKGDAESNNFDGLYWLVSVDGGDWQELGSHSGVVPEWERVVADVSAGAGTSIQVRFVFKSDFACSVDTPAPEGCGAGEYIAFWVDEITVSPTIA